MTSDHYYYRPATPPYSQIPLIPPDSNHSRGTSGSSSAWSHDSSPNSVLTHVTTPSRSPLRQYGPTLLPRIRTQDQSVEPTLKVSKSHRRALSSTCNPPGYPQPPAPRPAAYRSATSPPECVPLNSPLSATSTLNSWANSALNSPITFTPSYGRRPGHSRASSASVVDEFALRQYGYPTYRSLPQYISRSPHYAPSVVPGASTFVPPPVSAPSQPQHLAQELLFMREDDPVVKLTDYLTGPNPAVNLVSNQPNAVLGRGQQMHAWWDIRNLEVWEGFDLKTIKSIPDFDKLLDINIPAKALQVPYISQSRLQPHSEAELTGIYRDFYAAKVNSALKACQGHNHISMRAERTKDGPDFIANYQNDVESTLSGNGRGRVVGLVKSFDRWNTGMRHEVGQRKIFYLTALAQLHRCMREHSCRYGFIITEIELVCVRAGTEDSIPFFGQLELAPTIELKTQSGLTAAMALWYLHMLAKNTPLQGQCGWKLDVGPASAMTRTKVLPEKDEWIPNPQSAEKRNAKLARGWVMPGDPWNKKKEGGGRRR